MTAQPALDIMDARSKAIEADSLVFGQRGFGLQRRESSDLCAMACDGLAGVFMCGAEQAGIRGWLERRCMFVDKDSNRSKRGEL